MDIMKQYTVDAFTEHVFHSNPAAACVLEQWSSESLMQNMAIKTTYPKLRLLSKKGLTIICAGSLQGVRLTFAAMQPWQRLSSWWIFMNRRPTKSDSKHVAVSCGGGPCLWVWALSHRPLLVEEAETRQSHCLPSLQPGRNPALPYGGQSSNPCRKRRFVCSFRSIPRRVHLRNFQFSLYKYTIVCS